MISSLRHDQEVRANFYTAFDEAIAADQTTPVTASEIEKKLAKALVVSDHLEQIGSGPKSWIQTVVATRISPKNLLRGPQEGFLWPKNRFYSKHF